MSAPRTFSDLYDASIAELNDGLNGGLFTSVDLTKAYLMRIAEVNDKLHAVIETGPRVLEQAAALDAERKGKGPRGPLHGIPLLIKDNIATAAEDGMQTTAGSYALVDAFPPRPAHVAQLLTQAGALLLGKANLAEWANFRGTGLAGWSARGGQCTNAYVPHGDPGSSSSGSGVAAAAGLAAACVGTETDGSIVSPSRRNCVVGIKPTVGLTSRAGVIPISSTQDSVGPIARCVADCALLLNAMAGPDPRDAASLTQPPRVPDHTARLSLDALRDARIGVPRALIPAHRTLDTPMSAFEEALDVIRGLGAEVVDPAEMPSAEIIAGERVGMLESEQCVMETEFRPGVEAYFAELPDVPSGVRTFADLIAFNDAHADKELVAPYDSQTRLLACLNSEVNDEYHAAVKENYRLGRTDGINAALAKHDLDALVLPADAHASTVTALAGYPVISVPLGFRGPDTPTERNGPLVTLAPGMPYALTFVGGAWSEQALLGFAYAFEAATRARDGAKARAYEGAVAETGLEDVVNK